MKIVKWTYGKYWEKDIYMEEYELLLGKKISLSIGSYEGLQFSTCGLGLTKSEREILDSKFLKIEGQVNIYIGKLILSYNKKGMLKDGFKNVDIKYVMSLSKFLKFRIQNYFGYTFKRKVNIKISKLLKATLFRNKEVFEICESYSDPKIIKCDRLTAYQLASNYEADLLQNGKYLLSCLGFEYEQNERLIKKNLGKLFTNKKGFNLFGYSDWSQVEILK